MGNCSAKKPGGTGNGGRRPPQSLQRNDSETKAMEFEPEGYAPSGI